MTDVLAVPRLSGTRHTIRCKASQAEDVQVAIDCFVATQGWSVFDHFRVPAYSGGCVGHDTLVVWELRRHPTGMPYVGTQRRR